MTARMVSSWSWARAMWFLSLKPEPISIAVPRTRQLRPIYLDLFPETSLRPPVANLFHSCRALHASLL